MELEIIKTEMAAWKSQNGVKPSIKTGNGFAVIVSGFTGMEVINKSGETIKGNVIHRDAVRAKAIKLIK